MNYDVNGVKKLNWTITTYVFLSWKRREKEIWKQIKNTNHTNTFLVVEKLLQNSQIWSATVPFLANSF